MPRVAASPHPAAYAVHWFRRDLRSVGNPALDRVRREHSGRVVGLFCFDSAFLARPDFSADRFGFFLSTLRALRDELRGQGSDLLVLDVGPREAFARLWEKLRSLDRPWPAAVSFNRDYEPFARARDEAVTRQLAVEYGAQVITERDHLLIEPDEIVRSDKGPSFYQVFTPFSRRWFETLHTPAVQARIETQQKAIVAAERATHRRADAESPRFTWTDVFGSAPPLEDQLDRYERENANRVGVPLPAVGFAAAIKGLREFQSARLADYAARRDLPAERGTSQMSIYLKNGTLTTAQVIAALQLADVRIEKKSPPKSPAVYVKELAWREFYYHILYHRPDVEGASFLERYRELRWENRDDLFEAWKAGRTGYPIVDAGMRQLRETGWMHNRVRMIVASFLTKDLLIDWRWGERYFMETLLDGDLAPNNGGWQWAASTGCDPQPYFRIFNPELQGKKFDPTGEYVRRWVPELRRVPTRRIHAPHGVPEAADYAPPIVDHAKQKEKALAMYRGR